MSDGIIDCRREEEKKAAGMVEVCCANCQDYKTLAFCSACENKSKFIPARSAIAAKAEELRNQTAVKQDSSSKSEESAGEEEGESNKNWQSERAEMIELLKECKMELSSSCEGECDFYGTPDCTDDCDTHELKKRIQSILKKAEATK